MTHTLSQLLSSQEARDAAPCVPVTGPWALSRDKFLFDYRRDGLGKSDPKTGKGHRLPQRDIIWSGDLVAELAAVDALRAENERLHGLKAHAEAVVDVWAGERRTCMDTMGYEIKALRQALKGPDA
jgi:hypothetical protein